MKAMPAEQPQPTITNAIPDPMPAAPIVLFDGDCGLCDRAVRFILDRDKNKRFLFAPQQSQIAKALLAKHDIDPVKTDSVVLIDGDFAYTRSSAALRIASQLADPWPLAALAVFIPQGLRDAVYDFIARHRKQWFKKPDDCPMPTAEERERFIG
jgi:predicted DCC family thiol-disulfide oxidoreductase YuxK